MKRFIFPILWGGLLSLFLIPLFVFEQRTQAKSDAQPKRKVSKDILQKVASGKMARLLVWRDQNELFVPVKKD